MRYVMALAVMLAMAGCAMGAIFMMPGATTASTNGAGAATGYAYSFVTDNDPAPTPPDWIQADVLAVAQVNGIGDAHSTTTVTGLQTRTVTGGVGGNYALTVGAQGRVEANVDGNSADTRVVSVARAHSFVDALVGPVPQSAESVVGDAWVSSAIGRQWTQIGAAVGAPGTEWYQQGIVTEKPEGQFYADASVTGGEATYRAEIIDTANDNPSAIAPPPLDWDDDDGDRILIDGRVAGATTLEGEVTADDAEIKGITGSIVTYQISHFLPASVQAVIDLDAAFQTLLSGITGTSERDDVPLIAAIFAGSTAQSDDDNTVAGPALPVPPNQNQMPYAAAGVANLVLVAAENGGIAEDSLTYAAGTADGEANAAARVSYLGQDTFFPVEPVEVKELRASASKEDAMSADVRVLKESDAASAISVLAAGAFSTPGLQAAASVADTFGGVRRVNAGDEADGSDRTWAVAFIPEGEYTAMASKYEAGQLNFQSQVSGDLVQEEGQNGMGSGAFLQYRKVEPAYANMLVVQGALSGDLLFGLTHGAVNPFNVGDLQIIGADVMGPKIGSLGSSGWDGSGVSANLENMRVRAYSSTPVGAFAPPEISTTIDDADAFLWTDGTNDLQYNGLAFTPGSVTFDPAGYGAFTGIVTAYMPSPTQRETLVGIATTQPSIFSL